MQRHEMLNGEEGIRTLARFNTSTPLARAPLQPLEYFSITDTIIPDMANSIKRFHRFAHNAHVTSVVIRDKNDYLANS